ncbi:MAG: Ig-like domain-containing protein [Candidatus Cloacimonetes bacterium]|nr:Ig-like domain-containing protein [Candidatus Cloacimonadota bacterium]
MKTKTLIILSIALYAMLFMACEVLKPEPTVDSVTVSPSQVNVARGETQQFTATVNGSNSPSQGVTWSVIGGNAGTSISANGLLTVSAGEPANSITIRATSTLDDTKSGTATVNVSGAIYTSIVISPKTVNVVTGGTQQFTHTVNGSNNPSQSATWSVSGNSSNQTSINTNGLLTVASNENAATLMVTVTSAIDQSLSDTATVAVSSMGNTYQVTDVASWVAAIDGIRNGGNNRIHTINVTSDVAVNVTDGATFGLPINIQVTIQGGGSLSLLTTTQILGIGLRQTIVLRNITLNGHSSNTETAVVNVLAGGTLIMQDGSVIQGNARRGVWISNGNMIMEGGMVTGNSNSISGGAGVWVGDGGTMTMHHNAIISNNVLYRGGGTVTENHLTGAGVHISSGSTLIMEGGLISGNSTGNGNFIVYASGGVYVGGSFIMNNGEVSDNSAYGVTHSFSHIAGSGGIHIRENGSFTMNNGIISGNSVSYRTSGGGIHIQSGTFVFNGGTIINNTSGVNGGGINVSGTFVQNGGSITGNTANVNGGGVYISGNSSSFTQNGGSITGNSATEGGGVYTSNINLFTKVSGSITNNTAVTGRTAFAGGSPNRWRNADAGTNIVTNDLFWLND